MSYTLWWDAGFEELVSIVPPDAVLSPHTTLKEKSRGKAPGLPTPNGWVGYDWLHRFPSRDNVAAWRGEGAGLGLQTRHFPAVDIDVLDEGLAETLEALALDVLGPAPRRVGRWPKRLLLYRTDTPMPKRRIEWRMAGQDVAQAVEILGEGQQCVVQGVHPATGQPFSWGDWHPVPLGAIALTAVTPAQIQAFMEQVAETLALFGYDPHESCESATEREEVAQEQLEGEIEAIRAAVAAIPNPADASREDYVRMGVAIKAALPAWPDEAFAMWCEWAERWEGGENTLDTLEADWARIRPPYAIGAQWLYDRAAASGDSSRLADRFEVATAPPAPAETPIERGRDGAVKFSDAWLAARFVAAHGHGARYCPRLGGWLVWDGVKWSPDVLGLVPAWVGEVARAAIPEIEDYANNATEARALGKWCCSHRAVQNGVSYATTHPALVASVEAFDADPWLLNTPSGVINLRTGALRPNDPALLVSKTTLVGPEFAPAERWLEFLREVTGGDADLERYLKRLFGYALTGVTEEEMLAFFWGSGGNGKGTLLKTVSKVLGSYAETAAMETFTASEFDRHPTDLASLAGARLVVAQETQEGRAWDEAKIKTLTGSDPVKARFMRQDFFTYQPQFKLVFAGNHRPNLQAPDAAMLRRFHLIPFNVVPAVVDIHLKDKLVAEYPRILAWMIEGCVEWQREGLHPPTAVLSSTSEYFMESDPLGRWLVEACILDTTAQTTTKDLYAAYRTWCLAEGEECVTSNAMTRALKRRGFWTYRHPTTRERGFTGLRLAEGAAGPPDARATMLRAEPRPTPATLH